MVEKRRDMKTKGCLRWVDVEIWPGWKWESFRWRSLCLVGGSMLLLILVPGEDTKERTWPCFIPSTVIN